MVEEKNKGKKKKTKMRRKMSKKKKVLLDKFNALEKLMTSNPIQAPGGRR